MQLMGFWLQLLFSSFILKQNFNILRQDIIHGIYNMILWLTSPCKYTSSFLETSAPWGGSAYQGLIQGVGREGHHPEKNGTEIVPLEALFDSAKIFTTPPPPHD